MMSLFKVQPFHSFSEVEIINEDGCKDFPLLDCNNLTKIAGWLQNHTEAINLSLSVVKDITDSLTGKKQKYFLAFEFGFYVQLTRILLFIYI